MMQEDGKEFTAKDGQNELQKSVESLNKVDAEDEKTHPSTPKGSGDGADPLNLHLAVSDIHELEI